MKTYLLHVRAKKAILVDSDVADRLNVVRTNRDLQDELIRITDVVFTSKDIISVEPDYKPVTIEETNLNELVAGGF